MLFRAFYRDTEEGARLRAFLQSELAPFPGRLNAVWRFALSSALVIVISMTLQVPSLALSLIMVFLTAQENTVLTKLSGILIVIGTSIAVGLTILLIKLTIDYAMLRILAACIVAFIGMYFMRVSRLGSIGYLVAQFVLYLQSLVDLPVSPEMLVRALLWVWVAVTYPVAITIAVNFLFLPARPARLLTDEMRRQLDEVRKQLEAVRAQASAPTLSTAAVAHGVLVLHRHLAFATRGDEAYERDRARHLGRIAAIDRLHTAAAHLSQLPTTAISPEQRDRVSALLARLDDLCAAITNDNRFALSGKWISTRASSKPLDSALREMEHALHAIAQAESTPVLVPAAPKEGLISADAFSNPMYGRFALKTVLAALLCYVFYTAVQWPGIHTSMLTCFIIALPSLGASSHKGLMRVVGCVIGSIVALLATIFVFPYIDSITGLLLLTMPIVAISAWIAAGSPRTNYIGIQIIFAYALARLGQFGPTIDLTEIRDRMIGILIGAAVFMVVSTLLWPEREGDALKTMLARLLRSVANLARAGKGMGDIDERSDAINKARLQGWSMLTQNREMQARVALEPGWQYAHDSVTPEITTSLAQIQETLFAVNWLQIVVQHAGSSVPHPMIEALEAFRERAVERVEWLASRFDGTALIDPDCSLSDSLAELDRCRSDAGPEVPRGLDDIVSAAYALNERISQLDSRLSMPAA
ncbi:MAG TPA: FUSC family protein [Dyella sp.]|uniref:FUSC family protein n=1 Tax=Dyella sp. TaxID=1869338 RepID=UPI002D789699|nr:FUSC family protein [Dyella sp.]HET6554200.1 FUSC family protein [Dyella sp.]